MSATRAFVIAATLLLPRIAVAEAPLLPDVVCGTFTAGAPANEAALQAAIAAAPSNPEPLLALARCYASAPSSPHFDDIERLLNGAASLIDAEAKEPIVKLEPEGVFRVGRDVPAPQILKRDTGYFEAIGRTGVYGVVIVDLRIDANGIVRGVRLISSTPKLDGAVLNSVKQWRFAPTTVNGKPVEVARLEPVALTSGNHLTLAGAIDVARANDMLRVFSDALVALRQCGEMIRLYRAALGDTPVPIRMGPDSITSDVVMPIPLSMPRPDWPRGVSQAAGNGVTIEASATVGLDGVVRDVIVTSPSPDFVEAARSTISKWKMKAGTLFGQPVPVVITIKLTFNAH